MLKTSLSLLLTLVLSNLWSQSSEQTFRAAFYNVENLFDPSNDSLKNDDEFTPDGMRNWSTYRYWEKTNRMAKAILSIGEGSPPALIGLAEIENRKVLNDLCQSKVLSKFKYQIIHFESDDWRGIDVAMLYDPSQFSLLFSKKIKIKSPNDADFATRDLLYVKGTVGSSKQELHLVICHWPSRYGGQAQSEPKRILAAQHVKAWSDSLLLRNPKNALLIMGDLNDEWDNISIRDTLGAKPFLDNELALGGLTNLMANLNPQEGSHRYRGVWSYLDQIIVSQQLLNTTGLRIKQQQAHICRHPYLLETDEKYPGQKPYRSFIGMRYNGGFSDHLPVFVDLIY